MNEPKSTMDHKQHQSLADTTKFTGKDYAGNTHHISLRDSGGNMGVHSVAGQHRISVHDTKNDVEVVSDEYIFSSEGDANAFVSEQQKTIKSYVVQENRPTASVDERMRLQEQRKRHSEENRLREGRTSSSPLLDSDNY